MYIENSLIPAHAQSKMDCGKKSSVSAPNQTNNQTKIKQIRLIFKKE